MSLILKLHSLSFILSVVLLLANSYIFQQVHQAHQQYIGCFRAVCLYPQNMMYSISRVLPRIQRSCMNKKVNYAILQDENPTILIEYKRLKSGDKTQLNFLSRSYLLDAHHIKFDISKSFFNLAIIFFSSLDMYD